VDKLRRTYRMAAAERIIAMLPLPAVYQKMAIVMPTKNAVAA
jgi:hypothetical protein